MIATTAVLTGEMRDAPMRMLGVLTPLSVEVRAMSLLYLFQLESTASISLYTFTGSFPDLARRCHNSRFRFHR